MSTASTRGSPRGRSPGRPRSRWLRLWPLNRSGDRSTMARPCATRSSHSRKRNAGSSPPLHQPRPPRLRAGQPAGDDQGRALRPLLALSEDAAAPLPGGVRRRRAGGRPALRGRGGRAGGGPLRAGLHGLRRRLDRAGGRRPRRLRVGLERAHQGPAARPARGLPRAVHPLHPLRPAAARLGRGRLSLLSRRRARSRVRGGDGRALRDLLALARPGAGVGGRALAARRASPRRPGSARSRPRRSTCCAGCCRPRR